jgi:hypothetical protein
MRYQVERLNGVIEYVEADSFHMQEVGATQSYLLGGKAGGAAHYIFRNDPVERYGMGTNVAAFTDVRTVRVAPAEVKVISEEPSGEVIEAPVESIN